MLSECLSVKQLGSGYDAELLGVSSNDELLSVTTRCKLFAHGTLVVLGDMITEQDIALAIKVGRSMNARIFEMLSTMVGLVSATLPDFLQEQLDEFNLKKEAIYHKSAESAENPALQFNVERVREVELLIAEEKFNEKLLRFVHLYASYLDVQIEHGKPVPDCPTSWIYQDFPEMRDRVPAKTRPATVLSDLIFRKYVLRKDERTARTVWAAEQEAKWHTAVPFKTTRPASPPPEYRAISGDEMGFPSLWHDATFGKTDSDPEEDFLEPVIDEQSEAEIPAILVQEFGNRVPTTVELRQCVNDYLQNGCSANNGAHVRPENVQAYTNALVEAKMSVLKNRHEKIRSKYGRSERDHGMLMRAYQREPDCSPMTPVEYNAEPVSVPVKHHSSTRSSNAMKASNRSQSGGRSPSTSGTCVTRDTLLGDESREKSPDDSKFRVVELSCYSDRIY